MDNYGSIGYKWAEPRCSGFKIYLSHRKGLRLEAPGVLRRYFAEGQQVVNAVELRAHQTHEQRAQ